jgi:cytochrome b involved in lipid metabolism
MKNKEYKLEYMKVDDGEEFAKLLRIKKKERVEKEKEDYFDRIIDILDITENEYFELKRKREELLTDEERMKMKKFNFKKSFDIENFGEDKEKIKELFKTYDDPLKKKHYRNLKCILDTPTQKTTEKINNLRLQIKNDNFRKSAYADLITSNIYTTHKFALEFIDMLGFDINDPNKSITEDDMRMRIEDIKDAYNDEYNNICFKYNCRIKHQKFTDLDDKECLTFIKKIITSQYGFEIKKDKENYKLVIPNDSSGNVWKKLYEFKNNIIAENDDLHILINPININDQTLLQGFIED